MQILEERIFQAKGPASAKTLMQRLFGLAFSRSSKETDVAKEAWAWESG